MSSLATLRKFGRCVCSMTGVLSAKLVSQDEGKRIVEVSLCDQHEGKDIAAPHIEAMKTMGLPLVVHEGKAREPESAE
jgi:hypothetical protein